MYELPLHSIDQLRESIRKEGASVADLFSVLWKYLDEWCRGHDIDGSHYPGINDTSSDGNRVRWRGKGSDEYFTFLKAINTHISEEPPDIVLRYLLEDTPDSDPHDVWAPPFERPFVVALAIDEAFEEVHPAIPFATAYKDLPPGLKPPFLRYAKNGHYNNKDQVREFGSVVPTAPGTARERSLLKDMRMADQYSFSSRGIGEHFTYLARVPPREHRNYCVEILPLDPYESPEIPHDKPRIAIVPLAESPDDIQVVPTAGDESQYCVQIQNASDNPRHQRLLERAQQAIHELDKTGVHIAVFPELVVTPEISDGILQALRQVASKPTTRPTDHLQLVIAGSGHHYAYAGEAPYNECRVYHGSGGAKPLWVQRKLNHYKMSGEMIEKIREGSLHDKAASIVTLSGDPIDAAKHYSEHMAVGGKAVVVDSPWVRMVVTICEDFNQVYVINDLGADLRPDWVFVPVMDTELAVGRWTYRKAKVWGEFGCHAVVANSAVLPQVYPYPPHMAFPADVVIGLVAGPTTEDFFTVSLPNLDVTRPLIASEPQGWSKIKKKMEARSKKS